MIPAQSADGIDYPILFCQRYPIQKTVQFMEIFFDLPAATPLQVFMAFIQERQNRLTIPQFLRVGGNMVGKVTRDLSRIILSQCPLMAFFRGSYKVLSKKQLVKLSFL